MLSGFDDDPAAVEKAKQWQRTLADGGWAAITWPVEFGGRAAGPLEAVVLAEEVNKLRAPRERLHDRRAA